MSFVYAFSFSVYSSFFVANFQPASLIVPMLLIIVCAVVRVLYQVLYTHHIRRRAELKGGELGNQTKASGNKTKASVKDVSTGLATGLMTGLDGNTVGRVEEISKQKQREWREKGGN